MTKPSKVSILKATPAHLDEPEGVHGSIEVDINADPNFHTQLIRDRLMKERKKNSSFAFGNDITWKEVPQDAATKLIVFEVT